jgi:oligopeptide/dipeptide ABC transporter ATP-binding protein
MEASNPQTPKPPAPPDDVLLEVKGLKVHIDLPGGRVAKAVDGVDFKIRRGESVGLVGESGSGKTMTCLSVMRLYAVPTAHVVAGEIWFDGEDLLKKPIAEMEHYRGNRISMIPQDPLTSLNPVLSVGNQVAEAMTTHYPASREAARNRTLEALEAVRIPGAAHRLGQYPHQFSGGTRQRIVAAMGMINKPQLMIADEPTTALDVIMQAQFLKLLRDIQAESGMSMLWVTHDLGVVAQTCDHVNVMYAGRIVESGDVRRIFKQPSHPYTIALMESVPTTHAKRERLYQIKGQPANVFNLPPGCPFYERCPIHMDKCRTAYPDKTPVGKDGFVHCWARQ